MSVMAYKNQRCMISILMNSFHIFSIVIKLFLLLPPNCLSVFSTEVTGAEANLVPLHEDIVVLRDEISKDIQSFVVPHNPLVFWQSGQYLYGRWKLIISATTMDIF